MNASVSLFVLHEHFYCTYETVSPLDRFGIRKAIDLLDDYLGCPSTTEHLTPDTLSGFAWWLAIDDQPHSAIEALHKLWCFAFSHGLGEPPLVIGRPELPDVDDEQSRHDLWWQFKHHMLPSITSLRKNAWLKRQYAASIKRFEAYLERPTQIADVTDQSMADFAIWLRKKYAEKTVKQTIQHVRKVAGKSLRNRNVSIEARPEKHTIAAFFEETYCPQRLRGKAENTAKKYRYALRRYSRYLGHAATWADLNDETLADWRDTMIEEGLAPASANSYLAHYIAIWNFAWRKGLTDEGPTVKEANEYQREPVALSASELRALFHAAADQSGMVGKVPAADWWSALLSVLYDTGCRVGAVRSLVWGDIRTDDFTLTIRPESQKTRKEARRRVHPETMAAIQKLRAGGTEKVFAWPLHESYFYVQAKQLFLDAGLPNDRRYRLHSLRRTHGTLVADRLGDFAAADSLQHSHVNTFRRNYKDPTKIAACDVLAVLPRPFAEWGAE